MTYSLLNKKTYARSFQVHVESAFCPSCLEAMDGGAATLKYWTGADTVSNVVPGVKAVVNVATGHSLEYEFTTLPAQLYGEETLFGLELNPRFDLNVAAQSPGTFSFRVKRLTGSIGVPPGSAPAPAVSLIRVCAPNPFTSRTTVSFTVGSAGTSGASDHVDPVGAAGASAGAGTERVSLKVFDVRSRFVRTVFEGSLSGGTYERAWDGKDWKGRTVRPGIYFMRLEAGKTVSTAKVVRVE